MECDYHYLVTTDPEDVVKYSTRADALAALHKLLAKLTADGCTIRRELSGRYVSHSDGRRIEFWIDDGNGDIVQSCGEATVAQGREIGCPLLTAAHPS